MSTVLGVGGDGGGGSSEGWCNAITTYAIYLIYNEYAAFVNCH